MPVMYTWFLVHPGKEGELVALSVDESYKYRDQVYREAGAKTDGGSDYSMLSPRFQAFVYQWSVTEGMPVNWTVVKRNTYFPLCGPVFIQKVNEIGETVNMGPDDVELLRDYIALQRTGVTQDSWVYLA